MKHLVVEDSFWELFPTAEIAFAVGRDMRLADEVPAGDAEAIARLLEEGNAYAVEHLQGETFSTIPQIALWRDAFRRFKRKKGARCGMENLLKRAVNGNPVGSIEPAVDISNYICLRYALPVGAESVDEIEGDLHLGVDERGGRHFVALGSQEDDPTLPGEVCYWDDAGAVCRCWNWRDARRCSVKADTRDATLCVESLDPARSDDLRAAIREYCDLAERYLGARIVSCDVATRDHPVIALG